MGLFIQVYRPFLDGCDCTNGGVSAEAHTLCLVNAEGPARPSTNIPAVALVPGNVPDSVKIVPLDDQGQPRSRGTMFGGNLALSEDSRFGELVRTMLHPIAASAVLSGGVSIHDRIETAAEYDFYSR